MNRKELVKNAFHKRKAVRPPFLPIVGTYLTRVDQFSLEETLTDPGRLYQALRNSQQLLNSDGIILPLDTTLEAEAFGLPVRWVQGEKPVLQGGFSPDDPFTLDLEQWLEQGRIPVFREAVLRLVQVEGKQLPVFASVSGPLTVWHRLFGNQSTGGEERENERATWPHMDKIVQGLIQLCQAYGDAGVDGILINERESPYALERVPALPGIYQPLFNVIRYYNIWSILRLPKHTPDHLCSKLGADATIGCAADGRKVFGIELASGFWTKDSEELERVCARAKERSCRGVFLTTEKPLDQEDVDLLDLQEAVERMREEKTWQ
ncbi:hypothetical protein BSNK01_02470 [Bacillaceae bacterium]